MSSSLASQKRKSAGAAAPPTTSSSNLKQGNLFSFFSKKKPSEPKSTTPRNSTSSSGNGSAAGASGETSAAASSKNATATAARTTTPKTPTTTRASTAHTSTSSTPKPKTTTTTAVATTTTTTTTTTKFRNTLWKQVQVGDKIRVWWADDRQYYAAKVLQVQKAAAAAAAAATSKDGVTKFSLQYDDGESEWIDLSQEKFQFLSKANRGSSSSNNNNKIKNGSTNGSTGSTGAKRRRIADDSDDEQEWQDDDHDDDNDEASDDDDGSVFEAKDGDAMDEDDDDDEEQEWMVSDEEDDPQGPSSSKKRRVKETSGGSQNRATDKNKKKGKVSVTQHKPAASTTTPRRTTSTTAGNNSSSSNTTSTTKNVISQSSSTSTNKDPFKTPLRQFANTVSPSTSSTHVSNSGRSSNAWTGGSRSQPMKKTIAGGVPASPSTLPLAASKVPSSPAATTTTAPKIKALPFQKGVVNVQGAHVHNHLRFLQDPRDHQGRRPGEVGYDPRTLKVNANDWANVMGAKMTNAVEQWWELKSQYFDTVLLFKTGKFYEMFHMDADVGVQVLGLIYMKGHVAHAGFPEISYGPMADKLVQAGYKVARVEQTETPDQLKERRAKTRTGKKPAVVNREVCSIVSLGTRTFCALDDENVLSQLDATSTSGSGNSNSGGPLLAISEVLLDGNNNPNTPTEKEEADQVQPVCEYGITLVDAVRGTVTLGQFADDVLRSRMHTLLARMTPSEILLQDTASGVLKGLIKSYQQQTMTSSSVPCRFEFVQAEETFPKSTALDPQHRRQLERQTSVVHPWNVQETLKELHRRSYYPRASKSASSESIKRWPAVLQAMVEGQAHLGLASFGAVLYYLQRHLIDREILTMGIVKAYIPEASSSIQQVEGSADLQQSLRQQQSSNGDGDTSMEQPDTTMDPETVPFANIPERVSAEDQISYLSLDGTTLHNLEILTNAVDHKVAGSLWSKLNYCKSPHGARFLRAWLLRPLFRKAEIDRRADAVQELASGAAAMALQEARQQILGKVGDLDRLLSRIHSMSGSAAVIDPNNTEDGSYHPNERAVLYENATYTKRKVNDFSKALNGLRRVSQIPDLFADLQLDPDGLLFKLVKLQGPEGGCFPDMTNDLDWFFDNFDLDKAAKGFFEPSRGVDEVYDQACDTVERIQAELEDYRQEVISQLKPKHVAQRAWKYINIQPESKDKYLIELPASVEVPNDFLVKGKKGSGTKQINKYRTPAVARLVAELEQAVEIQQHRKAKGMQLIFAKFDSKSSLWRAAAQATAMLDALGSLAKVASKPGYCRPTILDCPMDQQPVIDVYQGRHPCVEGSSIHATEFVPNDLRLGGTPTKSDQDAARLLLLSGPNMGGKSTLLRQTCLIAILAQMGSYVPAEACSLTPVDCIYTRLGASDRILLGQSTFFVELAETAAALRGATRRSLVIMDELGRGTSTFDGTAIAGATVKHLISRSRCLSLFATHYHSLLDEWKNESMVRLGHMQCVVEDSAEDNADHSITFLYTLGPGTCPKSFGINVARLASLPAEVLDNAKRVSEEFEQEMAGAHPTTHEQSTMKTRIEAAIDQGNWDEVERLWTELKQNGN